MENNIDYKNLYEQERKRRIEVENSAYKVQEEGLRDAEKVVKQTIADSGLMKVAQELEQQTKKIEPYFAFMATQEFVNAFNKWNDKNK